MLTIHRAAAGLSVLWVLLPDCALAQTVRFVREPYLQQVTSADAVVVWATREPGAADVRYRRSGTSTVLTAPASTSLYRAAETGLSYDFYQHEASLHSLASDAEYVYDLFHDGVDITSGSDRFRTAPVRGTGTVRFIAFGDSGTGSTQQRELAGRMASDTFDLALHTGDLTYGSSSGTGDGSHLTLNSWFFGIYGDWLRRRPMFPSVGNHDSRSSTGNGAHYLASFVLPENGRSSRYPDHAERYYSFDYGPVHFVALDTELAFADTARRAEQLAWLDADLAATTQPWKVVYFHRSPYSAGGEHGSDTAVRSAFGPLFEKHRVQLVLSAHEHTYERTHPIRQSSDPNYGQVTYVVTGGGGAPLYRSGTASWTAYSASVWHYVRATATDCNLSVDAVGLDGAVFDRVALSVCGDPDPPPPGGSLPTGWQSRDIGSVGRAGSASESGGTFTVSGAGADVWGTSDAFHYAYRPLTGDGTIVARVATNSGTEAWTKLGVMIRESADARSPHAFMLVSTSKGLAFQRRRTFGGTSTHTSGGSGTVPRWVRLQRAGNVIAASVSSDGTRWTEVGRDTFTMASTVLVGLAVSSHTTSATATGTFDNVSASSGASVGTLPSGWQSRDIGSVGRTGSASESGGTFTVSGAGADVWGTSDAFHYAYRSLTGDGTIVARVATNTGTEAWTKLGVMIRESTDPRSPHAFMLVSTSKGLAFQRRRTAGGLSTHTSGGSGTVPRWVRLQRAGNTIVASVSSDGSRWTEVGRDTFSMPSSVLVGLAVSSHTTSATATGTFDNVSVSSGASVGTLPGGWQSRDIGSVGRTGSASESGGTFTVSGAGEDVWDTADAFHYAYRSMSGDGTIVARVATNTGTEAWTKLGVMIRESTDPRSPHAFMLVSTSKGLAFQRRTAFGATSTHTSGGAGTVPRWVRLERSGNVIVASMSSDGSRWTEVGRDTFAMPATVLVGLAVSSHTSSATATGTFDGVGVTP